MYTYRRKLNDNTKDNLCEALDMGEYLKRIFLMKLR